MPVPSRLTSLKPELVLNRNGYYIAFHYARARPFDLLNQYFSKAGMLLYSFWYARAKPFDLS